MSSIAFIHHGSIPGGAPESLRILVESLAKKMKKHQLSVFCARSSMISYFEEIDGVNVDSYPMTSLHAGRVFHGMTRLDNLASVRLFFRDIFFAPYCLVGEIRWMRRNKPDIIHLNSAILWLTAIAAKLSGISIVWHVREVSPASRWNPVAYLYHVFIKWMSASIICIGPMELASIRGKKNPKVHLIRNSISPDFQKVLSPSDKVETKKGRTICSVGGINFRKGLFQLIETTRLLPQDFHLVVAGAERPRKNSIGFWIKLALRTEDSLFSLGWKKSLSWYYEERIVHSLKKVASDRVIFVGMIDRINELLTKSDLLIFGATLSHSGRPIFEAWASGCPVLAFNCSATRMEIENGVNGWLVDGKSPNAIARSVCNILNDSESKDRVIREGRICVQKYFDANRNAALVESIYKGLVS